MNGINIKPTPKGARIPIGKNERLYALTADAARYYAERANYIVEICNALSFAFSEADVRKYTISHKEFKRAYLAHETQGNTNVRMLKYIEREAERDFENACNLSGLMLYCKNDAQEISQYVLYEAGKQHPFSVNYNKIEEDSQRYVADDDLPKYDMHRLIAALLTEFLGKDVCSAYELMHYFDVTENGQIKPHLDGVPYPPDGNKYIED